MTINPNVGQWRQIGGKGPRHYIVQGYDGLVRPCKSTYRVAGTRYTEYITGELTNNPNVELCKSCIKSSPKAKASARNQPK